MIDLKDREALLRSAIERFYFAYRAFTAGPDRILARRDLGRVHHRILYFVGRHPETTVNELLELLSVTKQALNAPLRKLVEKKLIAVRPDVKDRRYKRLNLTTTGRKLESQLTGTQMQHLSAVFDGVGADAEAHWNQVMLAIRNAGQASLRTTPGSAPPPPLDSPEPRRRHAGSTETFLKVSL